MRELSRKHIIKILTYVANIYTYIIVMYVDNYVEQINRRMHLFEINKTSVLTYVAPILTYRCVSEILYPIKYSRIL